MVFNATFNTISVISWLSVLLVEETGRKGKKQPTCHKSLTNFHIMLCISPWTGFEPTTLVEIGTDCTCSFKSNYHMIMTTTTPIDILKWKIYNPIIIFFKVDPFQRQVCICLYIGSDLLPCDLCSKNEKKSEGYLWSKVDILTLNNKND